MAAMLGIKPRPPPKKMEYKVVSVLPDLAPKLEQ